jgi:RNA polymerase sigma-70 factor, ECF subfamily
MNERELVEKIIKGDKSLFKDLIYDYKDKVLNVCYGILKNKEDAEDVTQEVFIEVYKSLSQFKWKSSLLTWIIRISITRSLNLIKKRKAKKWLGSISGIFSISEEEFKEPSSGYSHTPFENINDNETRRALDRALNLLPDNQRIAYTLSKVEELSNKQVCEIMNLKDKAVESLIFRAKQNLKKSLRDFYEKNYK